MLITMALEFYNEIIDISSKSDKPDVNSWRLDPQYDGMYPEGARDKDVYFSPKDSEGEIIKADWRYLFKLPRSIDWCPWQFWVEIIAYRLGCLIGVEVPPAHVGYNRCYHRDDAGACVPVYGALIEWFYDGKVDAYVSGGQIMSVIVEGYDRKKGEQHNLSSIMEFTQGKIYRYWAGVLTLDTLIANTDRHQDNWGWISCQNKKEENLNLKSSPAFDNGTALEYSVQEENFDKYQQEMKLKAHLGNPKRAKHHMKWSLEDDSPLNFYEFMARFALKYPETRDIILKHLCFERTEIEEILTPLCSIVVDTKYALTPQRLEFMLDMIFRRKELLEKALGL